MVTQQATFAVPGDLATPTGGYAYDRRVIAELRNLGWQIHVANLGEGFPRPGPQGLATAHSRLAACPPGPIVIDGLALGVMPEAAEAVARTHPLIALVHHPLALETGVTPDDAFAFRVSERAALTTVKRVITTSESTAEIVAKDYAVPRDHIAVAPPGSDQVQLSFGSRDRNLRLLSVGSIVPRKGYDLLVTALSRLTDLPWHLTIVGDRTRDPDTAAALVNQISDLKLEERVTLTGSLYESQLSAAYLGADVFVLASRFEGYGMAAAEAVAYGLPIVATAGGALSRTVAGAGMLVPPDDPVALAAALRMLLSNPTERDRWRATARAAAIRLPTWRSTADIVARTIEGVQ